MNDIEDFIRFMKNQNMAKGTIEDYIYELKKIPLKNKEKYLTENRHKRMLISAWRKYLKYQKSVGKINNSELADLLDRWKLPKTRGKTKSGNWYESNEWVEIIKSAPNRVSKMAIWIGFSFGLRLGEIIHLRVQDVDMENNHIHIRKHPEDRQISQESWHPKHFHLRSIPIPPDQKRIFQRWIGSLPNLKHPYILYSPRHLGPVSERSLQRWCKKAKEGLKVHDMRRSFAQNLYEKSNNNVKLVQVLMGHSNVSTTSDYLGLSQKQAYDQFIEAMS